MAAWRGRVRWRRRRTPPGRRDAPAHADLRDEPAVRPGEAVALLRREAEDFARAVDGAAVPFFAVRWREWPERWPSAAHDPRAGHRRLLGARVDLAP